MKLSILLLFTLLLAAPAAFAQTEMVSSENTTLGSKPTISAEEIKALAAFERKAFRDEKAKLILEHDQKRILDTEAFREQLEYTDPELRPGAIRAQNQSFYDEDLAFKAKMHQKNVDFLKWRVSQNFEMTEDERRSIYSLYEDDYTSHPDLNDAHHTRNAEKLEEITDTPGLTLKEKIDRYNLYRQEEMKPTSSEEGGE